MVGHALNLDDICPLGEPIVTQTDSQETVVLQADQLPAYCPNPAMPLWSSHPKVRLDLTTGQAACPYCGTHYQLSDEARAGSHGH